MDADRALDSAKKVFIVAKALKEGKLIGRPEDVELLAEIAALPTGPLGLPDISSLPPKSLAVARSLALALTHFQQDAAAPAKPAGQLSLADAQCELFASFERIFEALIGASSGYVQSTSEIKERLLVRVGNENSEARSVYNDEVSKLEEFYSTNAHSMFVAAKSLGGVKTVLGGQRAFGPSALSATRISSLYCDTQLIPDPVYPFVSSNLQLNAAILQLAIALWEILPLRPLVDARLPEPPVLVFPSFEQQLEENDPTTMAGIEGLALKVIAPLLNAQIGSLKELFAFAAKHEDTFLDAVMHERLFVPPGESPDTRFTASEARRLYLESLEGVRDAKLFQQMSRLPTGVLLLNGVIERLRPQFHILENSNELTAQPLLSQPVHWHYFERCATAEVRELVSKRVLSDAAFDTLRALQDDSLTWLANVPIDGLAEMRRNREHSELRDRLKKCTAQLVSAEAADLESVTKEVRHELSVLIQEQQAAIKEIERKYAPKTWGLTAAGGASLLAGAVFSFMPSLSATFGLAAPIVAGAAAVGTLASGMIKELAGRHIEQRKAKAGLLGMLATAHAQRHKQS